MWFAGNAIIGDIHPSPGGFANISSIVQFGFIAGTLVFALLTITDRFAASKVFFFSSIVAASANLFIIWTGSDLTWLFVLRFITGFFLAGIYPAGMKIAADLFPNKLGKALGFLVGALVLGTAFPHLLKSRLHSFHWETVLIVTSLLAASGGLLVLLFVPAYKKKSSSRLNPSTAFEVFRSQKFRAAAFGYFGHMWELYAFWTFLPVIFQMFNLHHGVQLNVSFWSFCIIAAGSVGCVVGGLISLRSGSYKVAFYSLLVSGCCCLFSPVFFGLSTSIFLALMFAWGLTVAADSPQFSAMVAHAAPPDNRGTALTIVTSLGFGITIISIQLLQVVIAKFNENALVVLFIGPLLGLISLGKKDLTKNREEGSKNI